MQPQYNGEIVDLNSTQMDIEVRRAHAPIAVRRIAAELIQNLLRRRQMELGAGRVQRAVNVVETVETPWRLNGALLYYSLQCRRLHNLPTGRFHPVSKARMPYEEKKDH
jgi:hypothetical protein